jgi:prophage antirepressor-like protein
MKLSIIEHPTFGAIRTEMIKNEPYFCAADVCAVLAYKNTSKAISDNCREKGITKRYTLTNGGKQETLFINEGNLYRLILKSNMPAAVKFEDWVCEDVLPSLRKYGKYVVPGSSEEDREKMKSDRRELTEMLREIDKQLTATDRRLIGKKLFIDEYDVKSVLAGYKEDITILTECAERATGNANLRRRMADSKTRRAIILAIRGGVLNGKQPIKK